MILRILFVDDTRSRLGQLDAVLRGAGLEADVRLRTHVTDVVLPGDVAWADFVFLDFDLCAADQALGEPCPETGDDACRCPNGLELVRRIIAAGCAPRRAVVHSATWRTENREAMGARLRTAGWSVVVHCINDWHWYTPASLARRFGLLAADPTP